MLLFFAKSICLATYTTYLRFCEYNRTAVSMFLGDHPRTRALPQILRSHVGSKSLLRTGSEHSPGLWWETSLFDNIGSACSPSHSSTLSPWGWQSHVQGNHTRELICPKDRWAKHLSLLLLWLNCFLACSQDRAKSNNTSTITSSGWDSGHTAVFHS